MNTFFKVSVITIILFFCSYKSTLAQEKLKKQPLQYRFWAGYSFKSIYFLGKTSNAKSAILGLGIKKAIRKYPENGLLYFTADFIPYIYFDYPKRDENDRFVEITGFGFSPLGLIYEQSLSSVFSYQVGISVGFMLMERIFPTDKGQKLNYTFDPSFTIETKLNKSLNLATGYKFHHISNGQTGKENPGLDSNFIFLSLIIK